MKGLLRNSALLNANLYDKDRHFAAAWQRLYSSERMHSSVSLGRVTVGMELDFNEFILVDLPQIAAAENQWFEKAVGDGAERVVLYGMGTVGRFVLQRLVAAGRPPLAVADARLGPKSSEINGIPCFAPEQAARKFGNDCIFVVTVFNQTGASAFITIKRELEEAGVRKVAYVLTLLWKHADILLPYYAFDLPSNLLARQKEVLQVYHSFADERSRHDYASFIYSIINPNPQLAFPASKGPVYFAQDVVELTDGEVFVDGGAFTGDTLSQLIQLTAGKISRYLGIEPDPINYRALRDRIGQLRDKTNATLETEMKAIAGYSGEAHFDAAGLLGSALNDAGSMTVPVVRLDQLVNGTMPSFIKLDIEGAELEALQAARAFVSHLKAKLAVCVYHRQEHTWAIPLLMRELNDSYRLFFRRHSEFLDDVVAYAIPV